MAVATCQREACMGEPSWDVLVHKQDTGRAWIPRLLLRRPVGGGGACCQATSSAEAWKFPKRPFKSSPGTYEAECHDQRLSIAWPGPAPVWPTVMLEEKVAPAAK